MPAARYGLPGALDTAIDLLDRDPRGLSPAQRREPRQLTGYPSAARRYWWDVAPPRRSNQNDLAPVLDSVR